MADKYFDTIIIGGGIGGLMTAYKLSSTGKSVCIIDKGADITKRVCPARTTQKCAHCKVCAITSGFAGAGATSDGKFNLGTAYGGTLGSEIGEIPAMQYIKEVDNILLKFALSESKLYGSNSYLKYMCLKNNLQLLDMDVRHLGTDKNYETMVNLIKHLKNNGITFMPHTECKRIVPTTLEKIDVPNPNEISIDPDCPIYRIALFDSGSSIYAKNVVIATGRSGSEFVESVCERFEVPIDANDVDIGVRVEMKDAIWSEFSSQIYEPKIVYKTKTFEDKCRMFCFNQGGIVTTESNNGILTANGHSYADPSRKTENCNFAVLSSIHFDGDFKKPTEYAENIAKNMNFAGEGNIIVQRFGDLIRGRRSTQSRIDAGTVRPTLNAFPGDISIVMPYRALTNIIETIYALDKVAPGTANDDTLLYGCENKYYSLKPKHNKNFEIADNLFLIGDGSGICRGLSQSAAMGLYVGDILASNP